MGLSGPLIILSNLMLFARFALLRHHHLNPVRFTDSDTDQSDVGTPRGKKALMARVFVALAIMYVLLVPGRIPVRIYI